MSEINIKTLSKRGMKSMGLDELMVFEEHQDENTGRFIGYGINEENKKAQFIPHLSLYYDGDREEMLGVFVSRCIFNGKTKIQFCDKGENKYV